MIYEYIVTVDAKRAIDVRTERGACMHSGEQSKNY